jgi:hypothetical protein
VAAWGDGIPAELRTFFVSHLRSFNLEQNHSNDYTSKLQCACTLWLNVEITSPYYTFLQCNTYIWY